MRPRVHERIMVTCPCGENFETTEARIAGGRGIYCSKKCMYKYMTRPRGLIYEKHKDNPTSFKKNNIPWNNNLAGLGICKPTSGSIKKGEHRGIATEFKSGQYADNKNPKWKGDDVGYWGLHTYIQRRLGKADKCEYCGTKENKKFHWHNISGEYRRDYTDWVSLCPSCHLSLHGRLNRIKKHKIMEDVL